MPHKDAKSAGANGARRQGKRDNWRGEDSTPAPGRNRPVVSTPPKRKSTRDERRTALLEAMEVPAPWKRLADVTPESAALIAFDVDEALAAVARRPLPSSGIAASRGRR